MKRPWISAVMILLGVAVPARGVTVYLTWKYTLHASLTLDQMGDFVLEIAPTATGSFTELVRRPAVVNRVFDVTETVDVPLPQCFRVYATARPLSGVLLTSARSNVLCHSISPKINAPNTLSGKRSSPRHKGRSL